MMHLSIPDTKEFQDKDGAGTYTAFNIHINGAFHCTVRYRQLHHLHEQLKKQFGASTLPPFPPKRLLSLSQAQLDERRISLERYIQTVSQVPDIASCSIFNSFLLNAQQESMQQIEESVNLEVYLMNDHKLTVNITSTDQTEDVLEAVAAQIEIPEEHTYYFALYLVKREDDHCCIIRKLQDFESPYISLKSLNKDGPHCIVLRKSYWDMQYDNDLLNNRVTLSLLYTQAVNDIEQQWIIATKDQFLQLSALQQKGSKKDYLQFVRTLKYYGYMHFRPCITDYPEKKTNVLIAVGNEELNFRIQTGKDQYKEGSFKITRMRCWRITTIYADRDNCSKKDLKPQLEISFEYQLSRDKLQWINIKSDQAILISMCLEGMVDELVRKKKGKKIKKPQDRMHYTRGDYLNRDTTSPIISNQNMSRTFSENDYQQSAINKAVDSVKKISDKFANVSFKASRDGQNIQSVLENNAFEEIGDDDL
ncbi:sorting nexin-17 isoform X2 [Octopus sinensis]|uniref:Sorting nexin-17 n=1 Tax=Octopus sinensis TaxID=2607531 RepID=A0A6P7S5S0_9MOLL|nr:sorting nexin-17 isoform X2 [Octopus sinensis]